MFIEKAIEEKIPVDSIPPLEAIRYSEHSRAVAEEEINDLPRTSSGLSSLDELTGKFYGGQLIVLSAPTKNGKTTLAQTMTWNMAKEGTQSLILSYEMSRQEITRKYRAMDDLYQFSGKATDAPIVYPIEYFRGKSNLSLLWLYEMIKKAQEVHSVKFVVIDHLHFLIPLSANQQNTSWIIGAIVRELKTFAIQLDIPILLIAHTSKIAADKVPDLDSIRDSSFISQESDYTLMLWRERINEKKTLKSTYESAEDGDIYSQRSILAVLANRHNGKTGRIKLWFDGAKFVKYNNQDETGIFANPPVV